MDIEIAKISKVQYFLPTIKAFNRLETRPRMADFDRSLKAEIRDPLWLLTRQWQYGEFQGEDSASAAYSKFVYEHRHMDRLNFNGKTIPFDGMDIPLEAKVEREKVQLAAVYKVEGVDTVYSDLLFAVKMGTFFLKELKKRIVPSPPDILGTGQYNAYKNEFLTKYKVEAFEKDIDARQVQQAVADTVPDGCALYQAILSADPTLSFNDWVDNNAIFAMGDKTVLKTLGQDFAKVFGEKIARLFTQPADATDSAWIPQQLEYQLAVANNPSEGQEVLTAEEYYQGHLDWFSFDLDKNKHLPMETDPNLPPQDLEKTDVFMPKPIWFRGMPQPRYWQMEEERTDFGKINTSPTGLLHLILAEFGLIYSNDWFILPHIMPINSTCTIKGMLVTDVFGQHFHIKPANSTVETNWQQWAMFHHSEKGLSRRFKNRQTFYLTPSVGKILESEPIERVHFLRDEMSNMVWAVENIVPSQLGNGVSGKEMAYRAEESDDYTPINKEVKVRYTLGTRVPDNWIPFIPVHKDNSDTEILLQRARMIGAPGAKGVILTEVKKKYLLNEEEVPRAGVIVERSYQRTRWLNGKTFTWIGRRKEAGRGEGWSGLLFDRIQDIAPK